MNLATRINSWHWETCNHLDELYRLLGDNATRSQWLYFAAGCCRAEPTPHRVQIAESLEKQADFELGQTENVFTADGGSLRNFMSLWRMGPLLSTPSRLLDAFNLLASFSPGMARVVALCCRSKVADWSQIDQTDLPSSVSYSQAAIFRDVMGNPFDPVAFDDRWRTAAVVGIAAKMHEDNHFSAMPILADALQDAGCEDDRMLRHAREPGWHVRGCWLVEACRRPDQIIPLELADSALEQAAP